MAQKALSWKQIIEEEEKRLVEIAEKAKTHFMPFEGEKYKVEVVSNEVLPGKIVSNKGELYDGFDVRVKVGGKEKVWQLFQGDVVKLAKALQKHPDRIVDVMRPKGQKTPVIE